ncbi:LEA type 2 family protein [Candidatus Accumulibacter aalborgensis]|uniref:LEA type 2 family protein n=1 Tax=Candidatus Accumulibacter aalborgensis TaxID=1860102 RepID=UPI001646F1D1|nr:LEA type 2 family protein [Candidatus Accumulibacter aalborgensis]
MKLLQLGFFEQRFALQLRIKNPNDVELPISGLSFAIELNGQPFLTGLSDKAVTVPRFGEAVLEVTASASLGNALKQLRELRNADRDRVDYRIVGCVSLVGVGSMPFERRGDLPIPAIDLAPRKALPPPGSERT